MKIFRNEIPPLIALLISIQYGSLVQANIFKCCGVDSSGGNYTYSLVLSGEYFIRINGTEDGERNYTTTVRDCHKNEASLSTVVSIYPNSNDTGFFKNGFMQYDGKLYSPNQYCLAGSSDEIITAKVTLNLDCDGESCIRKCCGPLEVYDLSTYGKSKLMCVPSVDNPWLPVIHQNGNSTAQFKSDHIRNWCPSGNVYLWSKRNVGNDRKKLFKIMSDGTILMKDGINWKAMNTSKVCIDGAINIPGYFDPDNKQTSFSGDELDTIMLECDPELAEETKSPTILYGVALAISSLFLLASIIVYGLLWEKQNVHGLTLLGYMVTAFFFYLSLIITFFYLHQYPDPDFNTEEEIFTSFCGIIAIISHFFYLSSTCWLTVISFDIFSKFRILKLTRARSKNRLKFLIYLFFTLLVPSVIVGTGVILDLSYGDDLDPNLDIVLPRYGWKLCFLDLTHAGLPYLFAPMGALLTLNCFLYLATIFSMYKLQESTKFASANNSQVQKQRAKIRLFTKLFLLMGLSWMFEFIGYVIYGAESNIIIIIGDLINILMPVMIFIIFVCKREILRSLCQKYSTLNKFFSSFEPENIHSTASASSQGPRLSRFLNPVSTTRWFRARINSTMTDTSNISNQSIRSTLNGIDESPEPASVAIEPNAEK